MNSVVELYRLQEADLALETCRVALADVQSRIGESEELIEAGRAVEERAATLRETEKSFKEREWEADELRRKIEIPEQRMYAGSVRNPKELEDLQREVESLKRHRSELEDQALAAMEALDEAQASLDEAQRRLQELTDAHQAEQEELRGRQAELEGEITSLEGQRNEQAAGIDETLLRLYDQLRGTRQGRAVAKAEGGACQGCRISLPVNLLRRAGSGSEIVQCSNCERILYVS
jgi:hypothetical protein